MVQWLMSWLPKGKIGLSSLYDSIQAAKTYGYSDIVQYLQPIFEQCCKSKGTTSQQFTQNELFCRKAIEDDEYEY